MGVIETKLDNNKTINSKTASLDSAVKNNYLKVVLARMFSSKIIKRFGVPEYKNGQNKVTIDDDLYEY